MFLGILNRTPNKMPFSLIPTLLPEGEGLFIPLPPGRGTEGEGDLDCNFQSFC